MNKKRYIFGIVLIATIASVSFSGCIESDTNTEKKLSAELNIYNWEDYFGATTLEDFEAEFGVKINLYTFEDEEYMLSELESNPRSYDLVITSDSTLSKLIQKKALALIDKDNIPNFKNIEPDYLDLWFDPDNKYSIPYLWGTTGIAVDTSTVDVEVSSWSLLFDKNYSGNITMLNNMGEVIATALKYLGYSINTNNISQLSEAEALLLNQKEIIQGYEDPITIMNKMKSGEVAIAHTYVSEAYIAADENENISYIIPDEGSPIWIDCFFIPIDSSRKYTAEVFINYILEPEVSADIANYQWTAIPNLPAIDFIDSEILEDTGIYLPNNILEKCEYFQQLDSNTANEHNRIWTKLKS